MKTRSFLLFHSIAAASAFLTCQVGAADFIWGGGDHAWTDTSASGWNGGPPANWAGDSATINNGTVTTTAENNENGIGITLGGTGVLNAAGGYFAEYTSLSFVNGGTLTAGGGDAAWGAGALGSFSVSGSSATGSVINGSYFNVFNGSTFNVADVTGNANADLTISAILNRIAFQPSASLTKTGAGTLSLAANNVLNNIASVTIAGGTISQTTDVGWNQLNNLTMQGGTLESTLTGVSTFGCYWLPGTVTVSGSSASAFTTVGSGTQFINLGDLGSSTGSTTFNVADATTSSAADLVVSTKLGNEPFGGAAGLNKTGAGTMTLTAANTYTGGTAVNAGTLQFASGSLDSTAYVGLVNSTLQWAAGNTDGLNKIYIFNGTTGTLDTNGNNVTLSAIQDNEYNHTGSLVKAGSGTLTLTAISTYTGGTTVTGGTLELSGGTAGNSQIRGTLGVQPGATLLIANGDGTGFGWTSPVTNISINAGTLNAVSGSHIGFGGSTSVQLSNGGTIAGTWQWNGPVNFTSSGDTTNTISGQLNLRGDNNNLDHVFDVEDGAAATDLLVSANTADRFSPTFLWERSSLTKNGAGAMVLSGIHTHSGNTNVVGGSLELAAGSQLKFFIEDAASNKVTGSGTVVFKGIFNIDTSAVTVGPGATWLLVDVANLSESFAPSFSVADFTPQSDGHTWTKPAGANKFSFDKITGVLSLVVATDYDAWKIANGVTGGENDDDDHDGLTNHGEYAFALDPTGGSSINPITVPLDQTAGTFTYTRRPQSLTGLTYTVWSSTDLASWVPATFTESVTGPVAEVETVQVTLDPAPTAPKFFVQVRAN